ncbi:hypothetical protein [Sulfurirhabdus autotrophica]|uniref:Ketopantoate reductase n=1 Tax=Sulfurirhabdus autotrophica TaxID=1706046 RepID=A0A4R3Y8G2_9PROT|nr:hypothetical protein [Sulfurirhabdus autotrophica]TCV88197.1 hypothetical protein EDC63_104154 [Sulfurirhabdus autotrophica]
MTNEKIILIGIGQLGRIFAGGLLRTGYSIIPVNRGDDMAALAAKEPSPRLVLVAVAENDLHSVLAALPEQWKGCVGLIQNELLPRDWEKYQIQHPTVISVWFEKKKGMDAKPLIASPVYGPASEMMVKALESIDIPCHQLNNDQALTFELVRKNLYILTTNIAGMKTGGNVSQLWENHRDFATAVAQDVMDIQDWLTGQKQDRNKLLQGMVEAFEADPLHMCMGRSAPGRLARALSFADEAGLNVPALRNISIV